MTMREFIAEICAQNGLVHEISWCGTNASLLFGCHPAVIIFEPR
ncbi:MAG: hypothetical protein AB1486_12810 [Planctomycetota bacterium]